MSRNGAVGKSAAKVEAIVKNSLPFWCFLQQTAPSRNAEACLYVLVIKRLTPFPGPFSEIIGVFGLKIAVVTSQVQTRMSAATGLRKDTAPFVGKESGGWSVYEMVPAFEVWLAVVIPILGLSSVFLARCTEHSPAAWPQKFMFLLIFVVGAGALATLAHGGSLWAVYGAALALMAVGATVEFSPRRKISF